MQCKIFFISFYVIIIKINRCILQKVTYMEIQQPVVTFSDSNYIQNISVIKKHYGSKNPLYFMTLSGRTLVTIDKNTKLHFYADEKFLGGYKRSFVEVHMSSCDYFNEDGLFSKIFLPMRVPEALKCPLRPGNYSLEKMTTPYGSYLNAFPFTEGRLYLNVTYNLINTMLSGYTDISLKEMNRNQFYKYMKEIKKIDF